MKTATTSKLGIEDGFYIVVLTAGFVYVGDCQFLTGYLMIHNAKNLRRWGTKHGLGELRNGPTSETIADDAGTVLVPISSVIHFLKAIW